MSFFLKNREQEGKTGLVWGFGTNGREEDIRKGCRTVNVVEIFVLVYENRKMRLVETIPGMGKGG
jgi:hypothetical protein